MKYGDDDDGRSHLSFVALSVFSSIGIDKHIDHFSSFILVDKIDQLDHSNHLIGLRIIAMLID